MERENDKIGRRGFLNISAIMAASVSLKENSNNQENVFRLGPVYETFETQENIFALTIDGGYLKEPLENMLDIMKSKGFHSTLFLVGDALKYNATLIRRAVEEDHSLGYHTMTHNAEANKNESTDWHKHDFDEWWNLARSVLGQELAEKRLKRYARAPGGYFSKNFIAMCTDKQLKMFRWRKSKADILGATGLIKGDILLLHALDDDLPYLRALTKVNYLGLRPLGLHGIENYQDADHQKFEDILIVLEKLQSIFGISFSRR